MELMIALSVLSTILVLATTIMIRVNALYTKGVNAANLQNVTRNTAEDLASHIQFSGETPFPCDLTTVPATCYSTVTPISGHSNPQDFGGIRVYSYCVGTTRYSYVLNRKLGVDAGVTPNVVTKHVLWKDTMKNTANCYPLDLSVDTVKADCSSRTAPSPCTSSYNADSDGYEVAPRSVRLTRFKAYENPANSGIYTVQVWMAYGDSDLVVTDTSLSQTDSGRNSCQGGSGTQFCAISTISTSVVRRLGE